MRRSSLLVATGVAAMLPLAAMAQSMPGLPGMTMPARPAANPSRNPASW